jgi:Type IV secretory pathway, VirB10 components
MTQLNPDAQIVPPPSSGKGVGSYVSGSFKNKGTRRIWMFMLAFLLAIGIAYAFTGGGDSTPPSQVAALDAPRNSLPNGQFGQTPAYQEALRQQEAQEVDRALNNNTSAAPRFTSPLEKKEEPKAPAPDVRGVTAENMQVQAEKPKPVAPKEYYDALQRQQAELLQLYGSNRGRPTYKAAQDTPNNQGLTVQNASSGASTGESSPVNTPAQRRVLVPAGKMYYVEMKNSANSDRPGPVQACILNGPIKGACLIGTFERKDEVLVVHFTNLSFEDGSYLTVDAYALDPNTAEPGVASDVDHRYIERYVIPLAASFISGYGQAVARSNTTVSTGLLGTTTTTGSLSGRDQLFQAAGNAGDALARMLQEDRPTGPLVTMKRGEGFGVMFVRPVVEGQTG